MTEARNPIQALEGAVDNALDNITAGVNRFVERSPLAGAYERFRERAPVLPERLLDTPLGTVRTPEISLPELQKMELTLNRRQALKAAIAIDLSTIIGVLPVVGDILADVVEDTHGANLRASLTQEEMDWYTHYDKAGPATLAALRTFVRSGMKQRSVERG